MDRSVFIRSAAAAILTFGSQAAVWSQTLPPARGMHDAPAVIRVSDGAPAGSIFHSAAAGPPIVHEPVLHHDFLGGAKTGWGGPFIGASFLWLRADFDAETAFTIIDETGPVITQTPVPFDFDYRAAPRVWAGWQDDWGFGFRVTWFRFSDSSTAQAVAPDDFVFFESLPTPTAPDGRPLFVGGAAGDQITAHMQFEYYTIDAELMQELCFDRFHLTFGGGFRHAALSQQYNAVGTRGGVEGTAWMGHRFDGEGPTAFTEVLVPVLGRSGHGVFGKLGLSVFGHTRGSIVYGRSKLSALHIDPPAFDVPDPFLGTARIVERDGIAIGELRGGARVDWGSHHGRVLFATVAWESQWLQGIGNLTEPAADQNLVLSGFSISGGIEW